MNNKEKKDHRNKFPVSYRSAIDVEYFHQQSKTNYTNEIFDAIKTISPFKDNVDSYVMKEPKRK